ncbi:hypothetical protein vseg_010482 [Gypsophila vaccaria]
MRIYENIRGLAISSEEWKANKERSRLAEPRDFTLEDEASPTHAAHLPTALIGNPGNCQTARLMVDASWKGNQQAAVSWVLWTSDEVSLEHGQRCVADSPLLAEALALREAIQWAKEKNVLHISVFSDCLQLVMQVTHDADTHHCICRVLRDIHYLISSFHCFSISFIAWSQNTHAHRIAKNAMRY